ncbi:MAG: hypothetical protein OHK0023_21140 [Anaerolineae bacterium]
MVPDSSDEALSNVQILLVEDEPLNTTLTIAMLATLGIRNVHCAISWHDLAAKLDGLPPLNLIFLDIRLPDVDGYVILEKLRADARFKDVPIVALTAQVMPDNVARAEFSGFNGFLAKPLNFDHFPDAIRRLLRGESVWETR